MRCWLAIVSCVCLGGWAAIPDLSPVNAEEPSAPKAAAAQARPEAPGMRPRRRRLLENLTQGVNDLSSLKRMTWKVGDDEREAMVYAPADLDEKTKPPVVFVFHGHGGGPRFVVHQLPIHRLWPEAVVVYAQGLPTPVPQVDPEGKRSGWQKYVGDQNDRDLKLFDAMLATMKKEHHIDEKRVYSVGHSNGAFFTYVLWAARGDDFAAFAPIAGFLSLRDYQKQTPKPLLHVAGKEDPLVKFAAQEKTIEKMRELNGCRAEGKPAGEFCTEYTSEQGPPVVTFIHPGGHEVPQGAAKRIVEFFQQHPA